VYMAPESMAGQAPTAPADIWGLGATVLELATGSLPWSERGFTDAPSLFTHVLLNKESVPAVPASLGPEIRSFLADCFQRDPALRPTARALLDHEFIKIGLAASKFSPQPSIGRSRLSSLLPDNSPPGTKRMLNSSLSIALSIDEEHTRASKTARGSRHSALKQILDRATSVMEADSRGPFARSHVASQSIGVSARGDRVDVATKSLENRFIAFDSRMHSIMIDAPAPTAAAAAPAILKGEIPPARTPISSVELPVRSVSLQSVGSAPSFGESLFQSMDSAEEAKLDTAVHTAPVGSAQGTLGSWEDYLRPNMAFGPPCDDFQSQLSVSSAQEASREPCLVVMSTSAASGGEAELTDADRESVLSNARLVPPLQAAVMAARSAAAQDFPRHRDLLSPLDERTSSSSHEDSPPAEVQWAEEGVAEDDRVVEHLSPQGNRLVSEEGSFGDDSAADDRGIGAVIDLDALEDDEARDADEILLSVAPEASETGVEASAAAFDEFRSNPHAIEAAALGFLGQTARQTLAQSFGQTWTPEGHAVFFDLEGQTVEH
jgi:hypothetical protein